MLAPHPFYTERGSPIAVDLLLRVLSERGDEIHVLTYHEGQERNYKGVTIHRIHPWPRVTNVRPGPSWKKIICDLYLFYRFLALISKYDYDLVHAVEESSFMAWIVYSIKRVPFLCDVDSSMTGQIVEKIKAPKLLKLTVITNVLRYVESLPIRFAEGVITMCDALADDLKHYHPKRMLVLKDISLLDHEISSAQPIEKKEDLKLLGPVVMYIGNLESYQGIDLLLECFALAVPLYKGHMNLVIIGGSNDHIKTYQKKAEQLGVGTLVHFYGPQPLEYLDYYMSRADVLVSPRVQGVNTSMKIYSYLDSGVAVLATDLPTHTQLIDENIAMLAPPDARAWATALTRLLRDSELRKQLAVNAKEFIGREHSFAVFRQKLVSFFNEIEESVCRERPPELST